MIKQFNTLQPVKIVLLLGFTLLMRLPLFLHLPSALDFPLLEEFTSQLFGLHSQPLSPQSNVLMATLLVFVQALIFNFIINHFGLLAKASYLPALMYITISSVFIPFMVLSATLIANFLVLLMLYKIFSFVKSVHNLSLAFDLGLIISLGALIYFPFSLFMLLLWFSLLIYRPFNWREWVAALFGFLCLFFFIAVYDYLNHSLNHFIKIWEPFKQPFSTQIPLDKNDYIAISPFLIIIILGLVNLRENFFKTYINTRKAFQIIFFLLILVLISHYIKPHVGANHFVLAFAPLALISAYYFSIAKKRWFYESLFILTIIFIQILLFV
jgi:hypothetical protein